MQTKTIAIIANGLIHDFKETAEAISHYDLVIAVDGGLNYCDIMGIVPDLIVGDFDSADPDLLAKYAHISIERQPVDKDKTDLEIALDAALQPSVTKIALFSSLEKRTDHTLINLHLARRHPDIITIESDYETLFVINKAMQVKCKAGQTVSLMPRVEEPLGDGTWGEQKENFSCGTGWAKIGIRLILLRFSRIFIMMTPPTTSVVPFWVGSSKLKDGKDHKSSLNYDFCPPWEAAKEFAIQQLPQKEPK